MVIGPIVVRILSENEGANVVLATSDTSDGMFNFFVVCCGIGVTFVESNVFKLLGTEIGIREFIKLS